MLFRPLSSIGVALLLVGASGLTPYASAAFMPGRVYLPSTFITGFGSTTPARIFEVDPVTRMSRVFATFPEMGGVARSLAFTPDGQTLRAYYNGQIMEINGDGQIAGSYTLRTGATCAGTPNAMAFAPNGDFYVSTGAIRRLRGDQPPIEVVSFGFMGTPSIAIGPDGSVFAADSRQLYRFTPDGQRTVISERALANPVGGPTIAVDRRGLVYARLVDPELDLNGIYRFDPARPDIRELVVRRADLAVGSALQSLTYSELDDMLYFEGGGAINQINPLTGEHQFVGSASFGFSNPGGGIAVYVPEPSSALLLLGLAGLGRRRG